MEIRESKEQDLRLSFYRLFKTELHCVLAPVRILVKR